MVWKRIFLLLLTIVGAGSGVRSQNVFPSYSDNATWHVLHCFWADCETHVKTFQGEMDLCGYQYSFRTFPSNDVVYFRSDSLRAYFRLTQNCADKEYLLYDFSMEIGDTVYVGLELWSSWQPDTAAFKLASIDTITQFGVSRRRFNMLHGFPEVGITELYRHMAWIEGVGSDQDPFYPLLCLWDGCESWYTTLCYDSAGTQLYQDAFYGACDTTIVGVGGVELGAQIELLPNPFTHSFRIDSDARIHHVKLYSLSGAMVGRFEGGHNVLSVELPDYLGDGLYVVQILTERGLFVRKVIKGSR